MKTPIAKAVGVFFCWWGAGGQGGGGLGLQLRCEGAGAGLGLQPGRASCTTSVRDVDARLERIRRSVQRAGCHVPL